MATQPPNDPTGRESSTGELLQSATTVASIALGLLAFRTSAGLAPVVPLLIFLTGAAALYASVLALLELSEEQGQSRLNILGVSSSIGVTFWSIVFLAIAYVLIMRPEAGNMIANLLASMEGLFRAP